MKHLIAILLILCGIPSAVSAQSGRKGRNEIFIAPVLKYYLNTLNIDRSYTGPYPFQTKNNFAPAIGIEYQRTTRYGLVFGAGIDYGIQYHDINLHYDLSNFDSEAKNNLRDARFDRQIKTQSNYVNIRFLIGYTAQLKKDLWLTGKVGVSRTYFFGGFEELNRPTIVRYITDDTLNPRENQFALTSVQLGDPNKQPGQSLAHRFNYENYEIYLGIEKRLSSRYIHSLMMGLSATRMLYTSIAVQNIYQRQVNKWTDDVDNVYETYYQNKNIAIGLRVGIGLWR